MTQQFLVVVLVASVVSVSGRSWTLWDPIPVPGTAANWTDPRFWFSFDPDSGEFLATGVPADGDDVILQGANYFLTLDAGVNPIVNSLTWNIPDTQSPACVNGTNFNAITIGRGGLFIESQFNNFDGTNVVSIQNLHITVGAGGPVNITGPLTLIGSTLSANSGGSIPRRGSTARTTLLLDATSVLGLSGGFQLNAGANISRTATGAAVEFGSCAVASAVVLDAGLVLRGPVYVPNGQLTFSAPRTIGALSAWAGTLRADGGVLTIGTATVTNTGGNTASIDRSAGGTISIATLYVTSGSSLLGPNELLSVTAALSSVPATATAAIVLPGMSVALDALVMSSCAVLCDFTGIVDFTSTWSAVIPAGGAMAINSHRTLAGSLITESVVDAFDLNPNSRLLVNGPATLDHFHFIGASATATVTLGNNARIAIANPTLSGSGSLIFANATVYVTTWSTDFLYSIPVGGQLYMAAASTLPNVQAWAGRLIVNPAGNWIAGVSNAPAGAITSTASFGPSDASGQLGLTLTDGVLPAGFTFFGTQTTAPDLYLAGTSVVSQGVSTAGCQTVTVNSGAHVTFPLSYGAQAQTWDMSGGGFEVQFTAPAGQTGPFPLPPTVTLAGPSKFSSANGNVLSLSGAAITLSLGINSGYATSNISFDAIAIATTQQLTVQAAADFPAELTLSNGAFLSAAGGMSVQLSGGSAANTHIAFRTGANAQQRNTGMSFGAPGITFGAAFGTVNASTCLYTNASASQIAAFTAVMHITAPSDCATNALYAGCNGNACGTHGTACVASAAYANCTCADGWRGRFCAINSACAADPCANGGTCVPGASGTAYTCQCPNTFTGTTCAEPLVTDPSSTAGSNGVDRTASAVVWPVAMLCAIGSIVGCM